MELKYVVFWIDTQREVYGDDSYYVLGEWMTACDTYEEAVEFIKTLNLKRNNYCTIMPIYGGK